jgi:Fur family ferric uptake transcriptional regulator
LTAFRASPMMLMRINRIMRSSEKALQYFRKHGLKLTRVRSAILESVVECEGHFDADGLYEVIRRRGASVSRATVYRTLPLLVKTGIIKETLRSADRSLYEHAFGHAHHDHLECIHCGKIVEFRVDEIEALQEKLCRKSGFTAVDHQLSIRGYCSSCARRARS